VPAEDEHSLPRVSLAGFGRKLVCPHQRLVLSYRVRRERTASCIAAQAMEIEIGTCSSRSCTVNPRLPLCTARGETIKGD